jgi:hypothetical protein
MATPDTKCIKYEPIPDDWDKGSLKTCCFKDPNNNPESGCDCCYDTWNDQLKAKQDELGKKTETANQAKDRLTFIKGRRDGFKKWRDGLVVLDEESRDICDQFSLIISQVNKICSSAGYTIKATQILFCMIRDFYSQMDKIKKKYEDLQTCIKSMDATVMVPGQGLMQCLDVYYQKFDLIIKTKEDIIGQIMEIIKASNMVNEDVCTPFGLSCILEEWQCRLNCSGNTPATGDPCAEILAGEPLPCDATYNGCEIQPQLTFPIRKSVKSGDTETMEFIDAYAKWVDCRYTNSEKEVDTDSAAYLAASKEKEAIASCVDSLKQAIAITDPKTRCK